MARLAAATVFIAQLFAGAEAKSGKKGNDVAYLKAHIASLQDAHSKLTAENKVMMHELETLKFTAGLSSQLLHRHSTELVRSFNTSLMTEENKVSEANKGNTDMKWWKDWDLPKVPCLKESSCDELALAYYEKQCILHQNYLHDSTTGVQCDAFSYEHCPIGDCYQNWFGWGCTSWKDDPRPLPNNGVPPGDACPTGAAKKGKHHKSGN